MWTINRIDHVVLWCRDLEKSLDFYRRLGFEINENSLAEFKEGKIPFVAVKAGTNNQIDLRPDPLWEPVEREKGNMQHLNVALDGVETIEEVVAILADRGLKPDYEPVVQGGSWRIDIFDPDNNRIEMALNKPA
ncbi:MAG: VOC family protein [Rhodospirillaceae bacterium]|jgi:catechol 2,3-dioxygenase-like lactoylglutathione lyase family enzyme